jgi:hypothetical protein
VKRFILLPASKYFIRHAPLRSMHVYEVRPRKDKRGVNLISDALPFRRLWYGEPNAVSYAKFYSRSIILSRVSHSVSIRKRLL